MDIGTTIQSNWLTTHLLCVGSTGSGKTGAVICLIEEAIKFQKPMIIFDIKGDLCNLCEYKTPEEYSVETFVPETVTEVPPPTQDLISCGATIVYLQHFNNSEQQIIIAKILEDFNTWMRQHQGSTELEGMIILDEIYGLLPPTKKSPCKNILMTLCKTARAWGWGMVLATQNPGDLDYRALSNLGTWMIGRLTTKRDRSKVIEGISGDLDESLIRKLKKRHFLLRSNHIDEMYTFRTRDTLTPFHGPVPLKMAFSRGDRFTTRYICEQVNLQSPVGCRKEDFEKLCVDTFDEMMQIQIQEKRTIADNQITKLRTKKKSLEAKAHTLESRSENQKLSGLASIFATTIAAITSKKKITAANINRSTSAIRNLKKSSSTVEALNVVQADIELIDDQISTIIKNFNEFEFSADTQRLVIEEQKLWSCY